MKEKSKEASAKGKETLNASANELEILADNVKKGTVTSVKRIEVTFARAYVAVALDSHVTSTESRAKKEKVNAGDALESANEYLDKSFPWAGRKNETGTKEVMKKPAPCHCRFFLSYCIINKNKQRISWLKY